jgi:undecaprenyl-diphosphatase
MNQIDLAVQAYIETIRTPLLTEYLTLVSRVFDVSVLSIGIIIGTAVVIGLLFGIRKTVFFLLTLGLGGIIVYFFKSWFDVARPTGGLVSAFGQSFPSYHATIATIFFGLVARIAGSAQKSLISGIIGLISVLGILVVSFSRIYLGVHWLSDVIGGIVIGVIFLELFVQIDKNVVQSGSTSPSDGINR